MQKMILGIDPGSHGALSCVSLDGNARSVWGFSKYTEHDIKDVIQTQRTLFGYELTAYASLLIVISTLAAFPTVTVMVTSSCTAVELDVSGI